MTLTNYIRCGLTRRRFEAMTGLRLSLAEAARAEGRNDAAAAGEAARLAGDVFQRRANERPQFACPPSDAAFEAAHDETGPGRSARVWSDLDADPG
jgi:hypothetical protein